MHEFFYIKPTVFNFEITDLKDFLHNYVNWFEETL